MNGSNHVSALLAPYRPTVPLHQLVERLNRLYHAVEASHYDERHPEIHRCLPPVWCAMIHRACALREFDEWSILDYGCGTGFEAEQIVRNLSANRITRLTCYDPSPEMLAQCREKLAPLCGRAVFTTNLGTLAADPPCFNLLATNSLLHHMPTPWRTIHALLPLLTEDAVWLQGHEPSRRFYDNPDCLGVFHAYLREARWRRFLSPAKCWSKLIALFRPDVDPAAVTARESYRLGLFQRKPSARVMGRLVDFHVAHSAEDADVGKGFDFEQLREQLAARWQLTWVTTYSYMGDRDERVLSKRWKRLAGELKHKYPNDGANFSCVWERV